MRALKTICVPHKNSGLQTLEFSEDFMKSGTVFEFTDKGNVIDYEILYLASMIITIEVNLVEVLSVSKNKMDQKEGF